MGLPSSITGYAARQHGLVTWPQLVEAGCSRGQISGWVRRGTLVVIRHGVYRLPGTTATPEQRVHGAVLRAGSGARAYGITACALLNLEGFALRETIYVAVPPQRKVRNVQFTVVRAPTTPGDRALVRGIPSVVAALALVEAASSVSDRRLRVGIDSARRKRLLTTERLERQASKSSSRGATIVRRLVGDGVLLQESEGERGFAAVLERLDPPVVWQLTVLPGCRPDCAWPDVRIAFEYEGRDHHTGMVDLERDLPRLLRLDVANWHVIRITAGMLRDPDRLIQQIELIRRRRLAELNAGNPRAGVPNGR